LSLIRRKFAKNPNDLIRCKFSIDGDFGGEIELSDASTISKPYRIRAGNLSFTIRTE